MTDAPLPPHSPATEQHVLAVCLLDEGATLARAKEQGVTDLSFFLPETRTIWRAIQNLPTPALELLIPELGEEGMKAVGGMPYLMELTSGIATTAHAGLMIGKLRDYEQKRVLIRGASELIERASNGTSIDELSVMAEALCPAAPRPKFEPDSRRVTLASNPPEPTTRLFLAKKPIATPGNLCTIISRAKTGKTAALGGAVAAIIAAHHDRPGMDTLGFSSPHTDEAVVLIDTEQSPYDAYTCHQRALARAGQKDDPPWLCHYAMVGVGCTELQAALPLILARAKARHKGVFTLILDGVADFVPSVNDEVACNAFIAWLRSLAIEYNCPILTVIHSNEGIKNGDDGRGWLGKELTRKAESNLLLKKVGPITTITSEKQRKAPITEADGVAFAWDEDQQRHITCQKPEGSSDKKGRAYTYQFEDVESIFPKHGSKAMTRNALYRFAADLVSIKETAFRDLLHRAVQTGQLERVPDAQGFCYRLPKL